GGRAYIPNSVSSFGPREQSEASVGRSVALPPLALRERVGGTRCPRDPTLDQAFRAASWWHEDSAEAWLRHGEYLVDVMRAQLPAELELDGARVLDFGCGAGRVLRHIPDVIGPDGEAH